jgi:hypothetical protein
MVRLDTLTFARSVDSFLRRPTRDSVRVSPDKWRDYRENHEFLNPSCLCALLQPQGEGKIVCNTEAAIYLRPYGRYKGEWVAECAKGCCGYLGRSLFPLKIGVLTPCRLVPLERLHKKRGLPVKNYPRRSESLMSEDVRRVADEKQTCWVSQCTFRLVFTTQKKTLSLDLLRDH